ncbi:MAG: hypothetical protein PHT19_11150 [Methylococcus sp.]|nr:hypothetical protein [Methylococcus sp.]
MTDDESSQVTFPMIPYPSPYVSREMFSQFSGMDIGIVDAWVERGRIPSKLIGKHRLVNIAKMWHEAIQQEHTL